MKQKEEPKYRQFVHRFVCIVTTIHRPTDIHVHTCICALRRYNVNKQLHLTYEYILSKVNSNIITPSPIMRFPITHFLLTGLARRLGIFALHSSTT